MAKKKDGYWRMLAAVTLVVTTLACGCASQPAVDDAVGHGESLVSEEGQIAFTRIVKWEGTDVEADIYTINVDGTAERKLTDTPGLDRFPTWSRDGQRLAFVSDRAGDGNWEIYVMDSDGTHQRRLTNTPEQDEALPAWSPDGEQIAYATDFIGDGQVWVMNTDGSNRQQLGSGLFPNWSPDGEQIAYTTYLGKAYLAVMNADGSERRSLGTSVLQRLLSIGGGDEPAWAPHDERIAYVVPRWHPHSLHLRLHQGHWGDIRDELRRLGPHQTYRRPSGRRLSCLAAVMSEPYSRTSENKNSRKCGCRGFSEVRASGQLDAPAAL